MQKYNALLVSITSPVSIQNCLLRYDVLVYNGSVHYWQVSRILQREGLRSHLLPSCQIVVDAVRKVPNKQEWLSSLLLQLALAQLEVTQNHSFAIPLDLLDSIPGCSFWRKIQQQHTCDLLKVMTS